MWSRSQQMYPAAVMVVIGISLVDDYLLHHG